MSQPIARKLIIEQPSFELQFETVQENREAPKRLYISGEYIMMNRKNKNQRIYEETEMVPAIGMFEDTYIKTGRAGGELNHSQSPDMDLGKLAHKIVSLTRDSSNPDYFIGKSKVLSTPSGKILESLIEDGLKFGMSTKCLGQIQEQEGKGYHVVTSPIVLGVDAVYDPSVSTAFVNGILENKSYIIADDGNVAEAYSQLEKRLSKYPSRHRDAINDYIRESLEKFLKQL